MCEVATYSEVVRKNFDPTHTTVLRNMYSMDMKRRFGELISAIKKGVAINDCFGLKNISTYQITIPNSGEFNFPRSQDKITAFMEWLQRQVDSGILTVREMHQIGSAIEGIWQNFYLYESYKRGILRARMEMSGIGMHIPSIDESGGINAVMSLPFHIDRLGLIFTRAYSELKGITDSMDMIISRILAQGIADGDGPVLLAKKLVAAINGEGLGDLGLTDSLGRYISPINRATILARTEIIRAHHLATIQEYRNWGVLNIKVKAEWKTAGDSRVCESCKSLEGKVYTLDEIEGMIPRHPQCRCIALPYIEELKKYESNVAM